MNDINEIALIEKYVQSQPVLSFSGLSKFLYSPIAFCRHYILNEKKDIAGDFITKGKLLHNLLLEPDKVKDRFIKLSSKLPDDRNKNILIQLYNSIKESDDTPSENLPDYVEVLGKLMLHADYYASMTDNKARGIKMITTINEEYWSYIINAEDKEPISEEDYECVERMVDSVNNDPISRMLLENSQKEFAFTFKTGLHFNLRGILDNIAIDSKKKKIYISDIKTTSKRIQDFEKTIDVYNLWLQAGIYTKYLESVYPEYHVVFTFIVIDCYNVCYPFKVSDKTMKTWLEKTDQTLLEVNNAFINRNFTLPSAYVDYKFTL